MYNEQLSREALRLGFNTEINLYSNLFTCVNVCCIVYVFDNHCVCYCVCNYVRDYIVRVSLNFVAYFLILFLL